MALLNSLLWKIEQCSTPPPCLSLALQHGSMRIRKRELGGQLGIAPGCPARRLQEHGHQTESVPPGAATGQVWCPLRVCAFFPHGCDDVWCHDAGREICRREAMKQNTFGTSEIHHHKC